MSERTVVSYKLTNGIEIIGTFAGEDDKIIKLEDAFFLQPVQQPDGRITVDYAPLTMLGKPAGKLHNGFNINMPRTSVLFPFDVHPGIAEQYLKIVDDVGLILPPEKTILT